MNSLIKALTKLGLLKEDLDYHLIRASMIVLFMFFGYQKWFPYEAEVLIPYISNAPLLSWMYPVFGVRGASWFLGLSEWSFALLLFLGFWHKRLGILGALGSCAAFLGTITIIPFMPDGWAASAGGFPAMAGNVPFLMKDIVLFAVSVYLLKQDVARAPLPATHGTLFMEGGGVKAKSGAMIRAAKPIVPPAAPIAGRRPVRCLIITPAQPHSVAPATAAAVERSVRAFSSTGPRLTISATPAMPSANPATRAGRSRSPRTGAAMTAAESGTRPLMIAR